MHYVIGWNEVTWYLFVRRLNHVCFSLHLLILMSYSKTVLQESCHI